MSQKKASPKTKKRAKFSKPLEPVEEKSRNRWRINVPANLSESGTRQRLYFKTKTAATLEAERIRGMDERWGSEGKKVTASLAEDAAKAQEALSTAGHDITLLAVVKDWLRAKEAEAASISFNKLAEKYLSNKTKEGVSGIYLRDITRFLEPFTAKLGKRTVSTITHHEVRAILDGFPTTRQTWNAYRTIRPVFSMAVNDDYCTDNPFDRIKTPKHSSESPEALTVPEVKAVFNACKDYRKSTNLIKDYRLDASDSVAAFACMVFAGIRPEEMRRLQWGKVHLDDAVIIVDKVVSKTRSHRVIEMSDNLVAWLETVPKSERTGHVVPSNWVKKYQIVRKQSGISKKQQDILRHSFASYHLAAHADFNALQSAMGHGTGEMILTHYKALIRKPEAVKFWSIRPDGTGAKMKATA